MVSFRGYSVAKTAAASLVVSVLLLLFFVTESCAFDTPSRRRTSSVSETMYSASALAAPGGKNKNKLWRMQQQQQQQQHQQDHRHRNPRGHVSLHGHFDGEMSGEREEQREVRPRPTMDRPTETSFDVLGPKSIPAKPKIVVLGATGRIGRNVIRQLMEMKSVDMEIVAFVRNYDKAIRVLYDDRVAMSGGGSGNSNKQKRGPKLQIVEGDLVPPEELPGFVHDDTEDEHHWKETAGAAADYYGNKVNDYDNRELLPNINESLEDAIRDCTTIISCVGAVRRTHLWHDVLERPLVRLLRADVSSWCGDGRHPFYVNYASTRKALGYAEREQLRREAAATTLAEAEGLDLDEIYVPRIRFIRISDLCVGHRPWDIVPVVANAFHSLVFRYHDMAERLLEDSSLVETVIIRPGDLVDEERDANTTSVQVSSNGKIPSPAIVGREDVASLTVAAATFVTQNKTGSGSSLHSKAFGGSRTSEPFHYTFGCRWVGQTLDSYPPQGHKRDGHPDPGVAFRRSLKTIHRGERELERKKERSLHPENRTKKKSPSSSSTDIMVRVAKKIEKRRQERRRVKPYGVCVAIPVYLFLALLSKTIVVQFLHHVPGGKEWVIPFLDRGRRFAALCFSSLLHRLISALPSIGRRPKQIYIPF